MATEQDRRIQALESQVEKLQAQVTTQMVMIQRLIICYVPIDDLAECKADLEHIAKGAE